MAGAGTQTGHSRRQDTLTGTYRGSSTDLGTLLGRFLQRLFDGLFDRLFDSRGISRCPAAGKDWTNHGLSMEPCCRSFSTVQDHFHRPRVGCGAASSTVQSLSSPSSRSPLKLPDNVWVLPLSLLSFGKENQIVTIRTIRRTPNRGKNNDQENTESC